MRRINGLRLGSCVVVAAALMSLWASPARASFHLWKLDEVFSNADGSQQFIEMFCAFPGQQFPHTDAGGPFGPATLSSGSQTFVFPHDLPLPAVVGHDTDNQHMLLATAGFNPLGVTPDYTLPAHFFSTGSDTLNFSAAVGGPLDSLSWSALPTDGTALFQTPGTTTQSVGAASAQSFSGGSTQTVPLPAAVLPGAAILLLMFAGSVRAKFALASNN